MGWFSRMWNLLWTLGRRRVEAKGHELLENTDALTPEEKEMIKETGSAALDDIKEAGDEAVSNFEK
ncbi:MAG: hypothetical protein SVK08_00835 [Halobacteriota archaeon]|nr:hypothetical protein [Halobacteriota archaeon]